MNKPYTDTRIKDLRTPLEKEIHDIVGTIMQLCLQGKLDRIDFTVFMGGLRDINSKLENKRLGCASGQHVSHCYCEKGIIASVNLVYRLRHARRQAQKLI